MMSRLTIICLALGELLSCATPDPSAPRQEVQSTWPNGGPRVMLAFRGDTVHERLEYHETGQLLSRGQLLKGERHGVWNSYYENGMRWSQVNYDRGEEHGSYRTYHDNGEPAIEGIFDEGTRIGTWSFYGEDGKLLTTMNSQNVKQ